MNANVAHLLIALLEHQRNNALHSDIEIIVLPDATTCRITRLDEPPLQLTVPSSVGHALAQFLAEQMSGSAALAHTWQEDILEITIGAITYTAWVRIVPIEGGEKITMSSLDPDMKKEENVFTPSQRAVVVDALDNRAGVIPVSAPTLGSTITLLHAIQDILSDYASPQHLHMEPLLGSNTLDVVRETLHRLPAFVLMTLPDTPDELPEIWNAITQAAIAGSVIVVGVPGKNTASLVRELHAHTPPFLWNPLFKLSVVHAPFRSACPSCAIPMPLHPDVMEQFSRDTDPALLRRLKSAHAPGCEACNFHGHGPTLSTIELCTPDHLPDDIYAPDFENTIRSRGLHTIIDDLVSRAYTTPVPLTHAAQLWRDNQ
ncbi:MAG: hypothetical protein HY437_00655 [Candidatus Magasanikbacteria bacterium]|nr:hypothetical protein [Candidatus Magasanikbacteria bacterium]